MSEKMIRVTNRDSGRVGYAIPEKGIKRQFAIGEVKTNITASELEALSYMPGGKYIIENLLLVEDADVLKKLGMEVEPEYNYTPEDVLNILMNGSLDQLKDCLDFAPVGVIEILKAKAVELELPDMNKRIAITKATGFNIDNAIKVNTVVNIDAAEEKVVAKKERRVAPSVDEGRRVEKPVAKKSKYNVVG